MKYIFNPLGRKYRLVEVESERGINLIINRRRFGDFDKW